MCSYPTNSAWDWRQEKKVGGRLKGCSAPVRVCMVVQHYYTSICAPMVRGVPVEGRPAPGRVCIVIQCNTRLVCASKGMYSSTYHYTLLVCSSGLLYFIACLLLFRKSNGYSSFTCVCADGCYMALHYADRRGVVSPPTALVWLCANGYVWLYEVRIVILTWIYLLLNSS
jgi:hypothetical protein